MNSPTPEFIVWSIEHVCPLREDLNAPSTENTWRHLRPLHCYSRAELESRIFEGICVQLHPDEIDDVNDRHLGFLADELFEFYGGETFVRQQCVNCPANAAEVVWSRALAGCVGMVREDATSPGLSKLVAQSIDRLGLKTQLDAVTFESVQPWYALWHISDNEQIRLKLLEEIFADLLAHLDEGKCASRFQNEELITFYEALKISQQDSSAMRCEHFPQGTVDGNDWIVSSHCYRCHAPMSDESTCCENCGRVGCAQPSRKRRSRGDRPYWSLSGFLGKKGAAEFLSRYRESRRVK